MPDMESGSHGMDHDGKPPADIQTAVRKPLVLQTVKQKTAVNPIMAIHHCWLRKIVQKDFRKTIRRPGMKIPPQKQMEANHPCGRIRMVKAGWE